MWLDTSGAAELMAGNPQAYSKLKATVRLYAAKFGHVVTGEILSVMHSHLQRRLHCKSTRYGECVAVRASDATGLECAS